MENRTYRYFKGPVLYPFGFGLSYAKFRYSGMKLSTKDLEAGKPLGVDISVENTSQVAGDEVAELYLEFPNQEGAPRVALRGFQRIKLAPGQKRQLHFELSPRDLSWVKPDGNRILAPGEFHVFVGSGQPMQDTPGVRQLFAIHGALALPD